MNFANGCRGVLEWRGPAFAARAISLSESIGTEGTLRSTMRRLNEPPYSDAGDAAKL